MRHRSVRLSWTTLTPIALCASLLSLTLASTPATAVAPRAAAPAPAPRSDALAEVVKKNHTGRRHQRGENEIFCWFRKKSKLGLGSLAIPLTKYTRRANRNFRLNNVIASA